MATKTREERYREAQQARYDEWYNKREKTALTIKPKQSVVLTLTTKGNPEREVGADIKIPVPIFMGAGPWEMLSDWHISNPRSWDDKPFEYSVSVTFTFRKPKPPSVESV